MSLYEKDFYKNPWEVIAEWRIEYLCKEVVDIYCDRNEFAHCCNDGIVEFIENC